MVSDYSDGGTFVAHGSGSASETEAEWSPTTPREAEQAVRSRQYAALPEGTTVIDAEELPIEAFVVELERRMLSGHSRTACRQWARKEHGLDASTYRRYEQLIQATWKLEQTTHFAIVQRRDELRAMYREVYYRAMNPGEMISKGGEIVEAPPDLMVALKTVDSMAKLDGLAMPDVAVQINQGATADGAVNSTTTQLTNRTRERTMELLRLARERAERHAEKTTRALVEARGEARSEEKFKAPMMEVVR